MTGGVDVFSVGLALHPAIKAKPKENNNEPQTVRAAQRDMDLILGSRNIRRSDLIRKIIPGNPKIGEINNR